MGKIIAFANQKGGVGKTTTCVSLTAALQEKGKSVLLCDFDPQANSTSGMGVDKTLTGNLDLRFDCSRSAGCQERNRIDQVG